MKIYNTNKTIDNTNVSLVKYLFMDINGINTMKN